MSTEFSGWALPVLAAVALTACAPFAPFQIIGAELAAPSATTASQPLEVKCPEQEIINSWTFDCLEWKRRRDAAAEQKRLEREAAYSEQRERLAEQEQQEQERREREFIAAQKEDERQGYRTLTFEDFALDARSMIGAKVAVHGLYTSKGDRLVRDPISAAFWIERGQDNGAALIPLAIHTATRDSRALILRCQESLVGWCPLVVRGRVQALTMRNSLGATSRQVGLAVDSVR